MKPKQKQNNQDSVIIQTMRSTRQLKVQHALKGIEDKVATLIASDSVKISEKKIPFDDNEEQRGRQVQNKLRLVQQTRAKIKSKLDSISEEENRLKQEHNKHRLNESRQKTLSRMTVKTKSQFSREDIMLLKKLKKEQKEFQHSLQHKTAEYNRKIQEIRREEQLLFEKQLEEQVEARKKEIAQRLILLQKQRLERQKQFEDQKRRMVEIKAKKKLFEEMELKQKEKERLQMQRKIHRMQSIMKMQEVDLSGLKEHQERYQEIKAQKDEERRKKNQEFTEVTKERENLTYQKSKIHSVLINEKKRKKEEEIKKRQHKLQLIDAARDYAYTIQRQHAPRLKTNSSTSQKSLEKLQSRAFSAITIKQMGNNYLKEMKSKIKSKKTQYQDTSLTVSKNDQKVVPGQSKSFLTKYRDYLSQNRQIKQKKPQDKMNQTDDSGIKDKLIRRQLEEVCKKAAGMNRNQGLKKLQDFAHRLEAERGEQSHLLRDKIAAKLRILQTLSRH